MLPFLRKLEKQRSIKFDIVKVYTEKKCRNQKNIKIKKKSSNFYRWANISKTITKGYLQTGRLCELILF